MSQHRFIALDIDGTLTRNDRTLSPTTHSLLLRAQQQGMRVIISSGRPTYGIAPLADALSLSRFGGFVLSYNGGEVWDWASGQCLHASTIPDTLIPLLYQQATSAGFSIMTYCGENIVTETPDNPYIQLSSSRNQMQIKTVTDFVRDVDYPLSKCMIVGEPEPLHRFECSLTKLLRGRVNAYRSEPFYLEVVPTGIDKAKGLAALLSRLGATPAELIACGDGFNDISMIRYAGLGVAMGNAQDAVKEAADYVTLSNEADGVAHVIRKFFLDVSHSSL